MLLIEITPAKYNHHSLENTLLLCSHQNNSSHPCVSFKLQPRKKKVQKKPKLVWKFPKVDVTSMPIYSSKDQSQRSAVYS